MHSFKDSQGHEWGLSLTIGSVKRVQDLCKVNLLDLDVGDPPLITRLATDVMLLVDVVFALIKPQADKRGITDEQFGESLGGEAILAAHTAFYAELEDFFRQQNRGDIASAVQKQMQMIAMAVTVMKTRVNAVDAGAETAKILGDSFGSLPGSSASTPTP